MQGKLIFLADTLLTLDHFSIAAFFILYSFADTINFSWVPHCIVGCFSVVAQAIVNLMVNHRK